MMPMVKEVMPVACMVARTEAGIKALSLLITSAVCSVLDDVVLLPVK